MRLDIVTTRGAGAARSRSTRSPVSAKWPRWLVPSWSSNPSAVVPCGGAITPALLTSRSSGPSWAAANARTDSRLPRSSDASAGSAPGAAAARTSASAASPLPRLRQASRTAAPFRASSRAITSPSPLLAPVTTARRPRWSGISSAVHAHTARLRDERCDQGVERRAGERADLRLEQRRHEERVVRQLDPLDARVRRARRDDHTGVLEALDEGAGEAVAAPVEPGGRRSPADRGEPRSGHAGDLALLANEAAGERRDDGGLRVRRGLGVRRVLDPREPSSERHDRGLEAAARAEHGRARVERPVDRGKRGVVVAVRRAREQPQAVEPVERPGLRRVGADPGRVDPGRK